jgi:hypothetical protein
LYARFINALDSVCHYIFAEATYLLKEKFLDSANILMSPLFFFFCPAGAGYRYEQSELIERELEQMTEQIKSIIQTVNANQVNALIQCFHSELGFFQQMPTVETYLLVSFREENLMQLMG